MTKGQRLKKQRELLNIGQTDLARKVGISKQTLYKYENDIITNIPSDVIERLSECLDCTPEYIMGWETKAVSPDDLQKALKLYQLYLDAQPRVKEAVELLLVPPQSDS